MKNVISMLVTDKPGALSRIIELFVSRGYNLSSICSGSCEEEQTQRLTLVCHEDQSKINKIVKQLGQIIEVYQVSRLDRELAVTRELLLARIRLPRKDRIELLTLLQTYQVNIIELNTQTISFDVVGTSHQLNDMIDVLKQYEIVELARTGEAAIHR